MRTINLNRIKQIVSSQFFIILLIILIWDIAQYASEFSFPSYLESIHKSYFEIGFIISLGSVSGALMDLSLGVLCDRISRKKLMIIGLTLLIVSTTLIFILTDSVLLSLVFLFWSVAYELWKVPSDAYFASLTDKEDRSEDYGQNLEITNLGRVLGPIIGGIILTALGFMGIISFYVVFLILDIFLIIILIKETNYRDISNAMYKSTSIETIKSEIKHFKKFKTTGIFLLYFSLLLTAWEQILITIMPLFSGADVLNLPPDIAGVFLACFSIPSILLARFAGKLADKFGKKQILFWGLIVLGASLSLFSVIQNIYVIFVLALSVSFGTTLALPALNGFLIDLAYKKKKGRICGIWNIFRNLGYIVGPLLGGILADISGLRTTFLIVGAVIIISALTFVVPLKKNKH